MVNQSNQNILIAYAGVLLVCALLVCQPIVGMCLQLDDAISLVESDIDSEKELEESNLQELEKVLTFREDLNLSLMEGDDHLGDSSVFTKNHWVSHSKDIFIHPPEAKPSTF